MSRSIIYLGMNVHKESITIAVLPAPTRGRPHPKRFAQTTAITPD